MTRSPVLAILVAAVCVAVAATVVLRQSPPYPVQASPPGIVGSWSETISPEGAPRIRELQTDTADGVVIDAASAQMTDTPETENGTSGVGGWVSLGGKRYRQEIISLLTDAHRHFAGSFAVGTTIVVSGDALTGTANWRVVDKSGKVQVQGTSTFTGKRIKA